MDSTPFQTPPSLVPHPQPLSSKSKLPIKRKTLEFTTDLTLSPPPPPPPQPNPNSPSPFKFHRIWTEPDEIRFLQGLLDSSSEGLIFPRDLPIFYHRFSAATSHPYTTSQLSEKLRRLRKKFRAAASSHRSLAALSPHNRELYDLSEKLWSPEFASISPFIGNSSQGMGIGDGGKVKVEEDDAIRVHGVGLGGNPNQSEICGAVRIDGEGENEKVGIGFGGGKIDGVASKIVLDVFDECVKEVRKGFLCGSGGGDQSVENFGKRWQEQRALELDVFVRRLRLVIEDSLLNSAK